MKTYIYIITFLSLSLLSFVYSGSKVHKTGWNNRQLNGKVKSIQIKWFHAEQASGHVVKGGNIPYYESYYLFDENGNEIESGDKSPKDHRCSKTFNTYNKNGYCTQVKTNKYGADTTIQTTTNTYTVDNLEIESNLYLASGKYPIKVIYTYDKAGNLLHDNYIIRNDTIPTEHTYTYDNRNNMIEEDWYDSTDNLQSSSINTYDTHDIRTGTIGKWYNKSTRKKAVCEYDMHGNIIAGKEYNADGGLLARVSIKIEYDRVGNRVKQVEFEDNKPITVIEYQMLYY